MILRLLLSMTVFPLLLLSPAVEAATLFGLIDTGELYASDDNGVSWQIRSALPVSDAVDLSAGQSSSELYLGSQSGIVYFSSDAGLNWTAVGAVTASDVADFSLRSDGDLLLLTETGILWESSDGGASFTSVAALTASNFVSLTVESSSGNLYALTRTGEIMESVDDGSNWITKGAIAVSDAVEIQSHNGNLYVITGTGMTSESSDAGASWTTVGTLSQVHVAGLTSLGTDLAAAVQEGEVATSPDGTSWTWQGAINQLNVVALSTDIPVVIGVGGGPSVVGISLRAPWPNPSVGTGSTTFRFTLPRAATARLSLYDVGGRKISQTEPQNYPTGGTYSLSWNPGSLAAGVYLVRLETDNSGNSSTRWTVLQ